MQRGIAEFQKQFDAQKDFILREATKRVSNSIVRLNPVDEGESVADWDVAIGRFPTDIEQPNDPKKTKTRRRLQEVFNNVRFGQVIFFENNDPVINRLEFGYSKQAPQGIVRLTARRWRSFVKGAGRAAFNKAKKNQVID